MPKLVCVVMMVAAFAGTQDVAAPPVEEALRRVPPDAYALEFLHMGLSRPPFPDIGMPVFKVGGGVTAPRPVKTPYPNYPKEARDRRIEGMVGLWVVLGPDGLPRQISLVKSLGYGLDEAAIEAVRKWRFKPSMKDGKPVAVQINMELNFRLRS